VTSNRFVASRSCLQKRHFKIAPESISVTAQWIAHMQSRSSRLSTSAFFHEKSHIDNKFHLSQIVLQTRTHYSSAECSFSGTSSLRNVTCHSRLTSKLLLGSAAWWLTAVVVASTWGRNSLVDNHGPRQ